MPTISPAPPFGKSPAPVRLYAASAARMTAMVSTGAIWRTAIGATVSTARTAANQPAGSAVWLTVAMVRPVRTTASSTSARTNLGGNRTFPTLVIDDRCGRLPEVVTRSTPTGVGEVPVLV
jgi:hypothetical protein